MAQHNKEQQNAGKFLAKAITMTPKERKTINLMVDTLNYLIMFPEQRLSYTNAIKIFDPNLAREMDYLFMNIYFWPHPTSKQTVRKKSEFTIDDNEDEIEF